MGAAGVDVAVVGAGALGLACGAALARRGRGVVVLERHGRPGLEMSSHNSEVIHAGLYYPPDSDKALCCVEGRERLYRRCREQGIPHRRTGKLVLATTDEERGVLDEIRARGERNGAGRLEMLEAPELRRREPRVQALAALWSPESGIVDAHSLLSSYEAELKAHGGQVAYHTEVCGIGRSAAGWRLETVSDDGERFDLESSAVVNAAGLGSDRVAALAGLDVDAIGYRLHICKGDYFSVTPGLGQLTRHLVYPVPAPGGLGIHVTLDLGGRYRLGPDAEYVDRVFYDVDPAKAVAFAEAAGRYLPEIRPEHLSPEMSGLRPKLAAPGEPFRDFVIAEESERGAPGLISLVGIESPGLTAAGAIAERVAGML